MFVPYPHPRSRTDAFNYKNMEEHRRKQQEVTRNPYLKSSTAVASSKLYSLCFLISLR